MTSARRRVLRLIAASSLCLPIVATAASAPPLTLERIMADPDWIGPRVHGAYWSADGRTAYYSVKRDGSPIVDLHRVDLKGKSDEVIDAKAMAEADGPPVYDRAGRRAAFVRNGDVFLRDIKSGRLAQITRTAQQESSPQFSADGRFLSFRAQLEWFVYDERSGVTAPAASLQLSKDPDEAPKPDDLRDAQLRIFTTLKKQHDDKDMLRHHADDMRRDDASRSELPFYLGEDVKIVDTTLSPDAHWLVVITAPKDAAAGTKGKLTRYVTESGYEEFDEERLRVGRNPPAGQSVLLLNLADHSIHPLPLDGLPGISDDPLKAVREENAAASPAPAAPAAGLPTPIPAAAPKPRAVIVKQDDPEASPGGVVFSEDSQRVALEFRAVDNKDRWIATVNVGSYALVPQHRVSDVAWVGWDFNDFGWLKNGRTLWFESEESGFGQLYTKAPAEPAHALTNGHFEVLAPELSPDGRWFYVLSNAEAPYAKDVYRVPSGGGELKRVTRLEGVEEFSLQHRGAQLLVTHSSSYIPPQLAVAGADGSGTARDIVDTRTADYRALSWIAPDIVKVPSSHGAGDIYAKFYRSPAEQLSSGGLRPAVIFVHGAGYTQDVHLRFPYYFREQMFHNLLVQRGYVVIDLDYRASSGYGRDWRAAIYRQMGHPELEDLLDGKRWLVEHAGVDPKRVGIYGGSYGGFMTLMALFRAPGEFAAGAALRPVTDWMQYEDGYTASILNEPQVDPIAYARSSPIEFAAGLNDPLLICHGVIDDNVLFEDSMRLYERLIELHKDRFSMSAYPLDSHGFVHADSWLDEYKRILELFEANLRH